MGYQRLWVDDVYQEWEELEGELKLKRDKEERSFFSGNGRGNIRNSQSILMQWDAQGMTNVKKNWKLWKSVDIVVFQETFLKEKRMKKFIEKLDKKFEWFGNATVRRNAKGRVSGGHLIGVRKR